ncbi:DUF1579 domain-containing protein [Lysobacter sp. TY2-98]|uniref:DUF1579 domain-containing protein n=1 Tax=Lysobacter sp. TY2-98 TaxID=2290922 RepID=UPI000E2067B9|nr:DUF1579 domain-containing protein [Lysobacter sp. TY2-98]AXK72053.1 DUF1579 domain-containing protein [Lysobacter sp. TY2-98]
MALQSLTNAPTDFDFVIGDWHVTHRRLKERLANCTEWVEFDGEMSTRAVLGGFGNIEDNLLKFPEGEFRAVALRSYDASKGTWSIWWLDGRFPDRVDVPVVGRFENGVGTFFANDMFGDMPIVIRFIWSKTNADHLRWEQAFSADGGASWETNWTMDFRRRA